MKQCPFCAEEILDAAIRCKHCRSDLVPPPTRRRPSARRALLVAAVVLAAVAGAAPVLARPLLQRLQAGGGCEPSSWSEWHSALAQRCVRSAYVCEHMTTSKLLADPEVARAFDEAPPDHLSHLSEMVGRARRAYGCAPEPDAAPFHGPGALAPPAFPPRDPLPRAL